MGSGWQCVVIDPGHGGKDQGAIGKHNVTEAELNLLIALKVEQYLARMGYPVVLTRKEDTYVSLEERAAVSANHSGCVFLSIHCNASTTPSARGYEIWMQHPERATATASATLASCLNTWFGIATGLSQRGVKYQCDKEKEFYVLRKPQVPSVLVECGFVTNDTECFLLEQEWFREKCAFGILIALEKFLTLGLT